MKYCLCIVAIVALLFNFGCASSTGRSASTDTAVCMPTESTNVNDEILAPSDTPTIPDAFDIACDEEIMHNAVTEMKDFLSEHVELLERMADDMSTSPIAFLSDNSAYLKADSEGIYNKCEDADVPESVKAYFAIDGFHPESAYWDDCGRIVETQAYALSNIYHNDDGTFYFTVYLLYGEDLNNLSNEFFYLEAPEGDWHLYAEIHE